MSVPINTPVIWGNLSQPPAVGPNPLPQLYTLRTPPEVFDVMQFGARGDGVTDDTAAIQAALTECCQQGGGVVTLPSQPFLISSTLIINADNVQILGASWGSQLIAAAGFPAAPMIQVQGPGGPTNYRYGIRIAELFLNGNSVAGGVGGLDLVSCYGSVIDHLRMRFLSGIAVHWDGITNSFSAYNYLQNSHITDAIGGAAVGVQTDDAEWNTILGCHFGFYQNAGDIAVKWQNLNNRCIGTSFDNNDTAVNCHFSGSNITSACQFSRGGKNHIYLQGAPNCTVTGNFFGNRTGTGAEMIRADGANGGCVVEGNTLSPGSGWPLFVQEYAGITGVNTYANNDTGGLGMTLLNGHARGNTGYNPVGHAVAQPAVPATTVPLTNTTGSDCLVFLTGGTFTGNHQIGGVSIGNSTATVLLVPAGQTITLTYSAAPTWQWFGS